MQTKEFLLLDKFRKNGIRITRRCLERTVGSLSSNPVSSQQFKSCDVEKNGKVIFLSFPRPTAVQHLRALAHGPSPPVVIPCGMVAPEVESFTGTVPSSTSSTHIYCKPVKIKDVCKLSPTSTESGNTNAQYNNATSDVKVPSSVVAIDVSGQPFSRMSTFRRSLIHVDFLIRRKRKKDKRRNTVAEGDVKELKDALQNIVNEECQISMSNGVSPYHRIITESTSDYNEKKNEVICDKLMEEKNNNADTMKISKNSSCIDSTENQIITDGKNKTCSSNCESKVNEQENFLRQPSSKRKPKSHIPISTVSAAMNVAVKMRQCNGVKTEIPVSNGVISNTRNNADSESQLQENKRMSDSSLFTDDDTSQESWKDYKKRLQEKCRAISNKRASNEIFIDKEIEASSSTSSENISQQDKVTVATSTESDSFIISSDESDEDLSEITYFQTNYGSSTSLGTGSGGSLNSLLSETGTEMTSSTGTLTSIGCEHLVPPPPPPPMILSATVNDKYLVAKVPESTYSRFDLETSDDHKYTEAETLPKKHQKSVKSSSKTIKPLKGNNFESQRNVAESSKNIFSSLVRIKTKENKKSKKVESKKVESKKLENKKIEVKKVETKTFNKTTDKPAFDMYGHTSPKKLKQVPAFIKENISPAIPSEKQNCMKSFLANERSRHSIQLTDYEVSEKLNINCFRNSTFTGNTPSTDKEIKGGGNQGVKNIPPKYEHQVTVTPVQRYSDTENKNISHYKESSFKENQVNEQDLKYENKVRPVIVNAETQLHTTKYQRPQPPNTLQHERSKLAARVVLDFDGKVIYSTNSLDRKHYNSDLSAGTYNSVQNKLPEPRVRSSHVFKQDKLYNPYQESQMQKPEKVSLSEYFSNTASYRDNTKVSTPPCVQFNYNKQSRSKCEQYARSELWQSDQINEHRIQSDVHYPPNLKLENTQTLVPKRLNQWPNSLVKNSPDLYLHSPSINLLPDPNVSGLPVQETMLTKHNVNLHSKHMENINMNSPGDSFNTSNSCFSSPSSEVNSGNIFNKSTQSTMSTEDLFAVIHDCKRRMNIKTDSDISLPSSSSRSSSPSYLRPTSRGTLAETGFLSPRNQIPLETSGDRRSWADFRPVDSICTERKSLASDRLGPTKPTSMHDFKMLLLQARSSSQISGPRKSAVEMLKVPLSPNSQNKVQSVPLNLSPRNSISFSAHNSPTSELNLYNGHSTVPFKRGNRVRTSLQSRYIMYPPIFEDCSEDSENCSDMSENKLTDTVESMKDENIVEWNYKNNRKIKIPGYLCNSESHYQPE